MKRFGGTISSLARVIGKEVNLMKGIFLTGLFFLFCSLSFAQVNEIESKGNISDAEITLQKQLIAIDLDSQIRNIPFAVVRGFARVRLVDWLWSDGVDKTGRAEQIAIAAIEDHFNNSSEIPMVYSSIPRLFVLLDTHASDRANQLRQKYTLSSQDEARQLLALLGQKDGQRLAVDTAVRLLSRHNETSPDLVYLLMQLEQSRSSEMNRLLEAILIAEVSGRVNFPLHMIEIFSRHYVSPEVPAALQRQFLSLIIARSRNFMQIAEHDQLTYYRMLNFLWPAISAHPELVGEASTSLAILNARVSRSTQEARARHERISNSPDRLAATVAEAERAEDNVTKYSLYFSAARLALQERKFEYAVDLVGKAAEIDLSTSSIPEDFRLATHDQFYGNVVTKALESDTPEAAVYAIKKMSTHQAKAMGYSSLSRFHVDKGDMDSGRNAYEEAVRAAARAETSVNSITILIRLLPTVQKIDPLMTLELGNLISQRINNLPTLNPEDKPDTEAFREYIATVMVINYSLMPILESLVKLNKSVVSNLGNRIERKEVKISADFVLRTDSLMRIEEYPGRER